MTISGYNLLPSEYDVNYTALHDQIKRHREPRTCDWLFKRPEYIKWDEEETKTSVLWIHGQIGCGKSTLLSRVIDELEKRKEIHLLYFYVKATEKQLQRPRTILWTFQRQIINRGDEAASTLRQLRGYHHEDQIEEALFDYLRCNAKSVYIIVDAIDEYERKDRQWLIESLSKRCHSGSDGPSFKILISSRNTDGISQMYTWGTNVHTIGVQPQDSVNGIREFAQRQIDKLLRDKDMQDMQGMKRIILKKLTEKSHGMFLWVALQMDTLFGLDSTSIPKYIEQLVLPKKMNGAYDDIMQKFSCTVDDEKSIARRVLVLLLNAGGPVAVDAVLEAISLKIDGTEIDKESLEKYKKTPKSVVNICKYLVAIDEDRHVFRFIHTSVYEYLLLPDWQSSLDLVEGAPLKKLFHKYPLMEFASIHWARHARLNLGKSLELLLALCQRPKNMLLAFQIFLFSVHVNLPMKVCPTHIVSYFHLFHFLDHLDLRHLLEPHAQASNGFTALHWALQGKQGSVFDTVKKLITLKSDINAQDSRGHTALYHASERGELEVVRELLREKRVKVDLRKKPYGTPLIVASYKGHKEIVKALIEAGADVTATSELGTALHAAASQGSVDCAVVLLDSKRTRWLDRESGSIGTPLHEAAYYGRHEIVRLLLARKFKVNKMSKSCGSPLQAASTGCCHGLDPADYKKVFEALFDFKADVNTRGGYFTTALIAAVEFGHEDLVELLIDKGANLDINGPNGTPYEVACQNGYAGIINLLQKGAENRAPQMSSNTPSGLASSGTIDDVRVETHRSKKLLERVFEHRIQLFLRALKNNNMKQMEVFISAYLKAIELGIAQKQHNLIQMLASIGERVFKYIVASIIRGYGVQASEPGMDTPTASIRIYSKMIQLVRNFFNKSLASPDGQRSIARRASRLSIVSQSYALPFDCTSPEFQILDRFTQIGVSTLAYAIEKNNWKAVKILAEAWTSALERVRADAGHEIFHVLFDARNDALQSLLSKNDDLHAAIMAQVSIQLVSISLNRPGYRDLARDITMECIRALRDVERLRDRDTLSMLLEALFTEFEVGIHTRDDTKLMDSSQAIFEFMAQMIAEEDATMVSITTDKCVTMWREAMYQGKGRLIHRIEVAAGARGYEEVICHIQQRLTIYATSSDA
ncbi:ankyrin repeat [Trichoderma arundinaceum]|uniref:Ankyrin repeat n=1 Tax=Trichoderma arundinaceum TaxID=490622 RepID=A0A395NIB7_TRIAR|nr:ankyrin repeat [Trichoderma arundinaceum]